MLLVGEIRDQETAEIATHAALTGHLVLSTLHTIDAPERSFGSWTSVSLHFSWPVTVEAVLAQRLVRSICETCKEQVPSDDSSLSYHGKGCSECRGTGYRGRTGIYELLVMNDELRGEPPRGRETSMCRVREGITTLAEIHRVTRGKKEGAARWANPLVVRSGRLLNRPERVNSTSTIEIVVAGLAEIVR